MNKIFTFFLLFVPYFIFAQSTKVVLIEEGSNASCNPCAAYNPAFHALTTPYENAGEVVVLKYQWYFPGYDPMHEHNPTEVNARFQTYYGQNGVPTGFLDGNDYVGNISNFNATMINNAVAGTSPFDIIIDAQMSADFSTINVTVDVECTQAIANNANMKLRIAVIEKEINFDTAPGSNGEKVFYNIMKKFLPGTSGLALANTFTLGETVSFSESWVHANVYELSELAVVAFIQDDDNKEVLQAAKADVQFTVSDQDALAALESKAVSAEYVDAAVCDYKITPTVKIRNNGNNDLTSCVIEYKVNNGSVRTFNWTGSIATLGSEVVSLPEIPFFHANPNNTLYVEVKNPNGQVDPDLSDNSVEIDFEQAPNSSANLEFYFSHDQYGSEITWQLKNSAGTTLYSGGPYPDAVGNFTENFVLNTNDCYELIVNDSYGDGQIGSATGARLTDSGNNTVLLNNLADYGSIFKFAFGVNADQSSLVPDSTDVFSSIVDYNVLSSLNIYPNPAKDFVTIQLTSVSSNALSVELVDVMGRLIAAEEMTSSMVRFNTSDIATGIYFVNIKEKGKVVGVSTVVVQ
ncbi:MAG: Omp28-related outer membrane protein [Chitinophagales bacterium]|nr:Omp28-related outer membrane protein [Chitinophagales bacterium]